MENNAAEIFDLLQEFVSFYKIQGLFVAGGYCRSVFLKQPHTIENIDIICAYDEQATQLGTIFASEILKCSPVCKDDICQIKWNGVNISFQGKSPFKYMQNQEITTWFQTNGIDNVPILNNLYGRDFTINALVYSLENESLYDPTDKATIDFHKNLIRSLLPPEMLIKYNPISILRALRLSVQYDFFIEKNFKMLIEDGIKNLESVFTLDRIVKEIVKILKVNPEKGLELIQKYKLDKFLIDQGVRDLLDLHHE